MSRIRSITCFADFGALLFTTKALEQRMINLGEFFAVAAILLVIAIMTLGTVKEIDE